MLWTCQFLIQAKPKKRSRKMLLPSHMSNRSISKNDSILAHKRQNIWNTRNEQDKHDKLLRMYQSAGGGNTNNVHQHYYHSPESQQLVPLITPDPSPQIHQSITLDNQPSASSLLSQNVESGISANYKNNALKIKHILALKRISKSPIKSLPHMDHQNILSTPLQPSRTLTAGDYSDPKWTLRQRQRLVRQPVSANQTPVSAAHEMFDWALLVTKKWPEHLREADARVLAQHVPGICDLCRKIVVESKERILLHFSGTFDIKYPNEPILAADPTVIFAPTLQPTTSASVNNVTVPSIKHQKANSSILVNATIHTQKSNHLLNINDTAGKRVLKPDKRFQDTVSLAVRIYYHLLWNTYCNEAARLNIDTSVEPPPPSPQAGSPWKPGSSPSKPYTQARLELKKLLSSRQFHTCLITATMEVALKARSYISLTFPKIIQAFDITAFSLLTILESVRLCCHSMPEVLVQHLLQVEYKILEQTAWKDGQAPQLLYSQPYVIDVLNDTSKLESTQISVRDANTAFLPTVQMFLRKLRTLAAIRIAGICRLFEGIINDEAINWVWTVVEHILEVQRDLLRNRHLDTLILCSLFAVARVRSLNVTFKHIISKYQILHPRKSKRLLQVVSCVVLGSNNQISSVKASSGTQVKRTKSSTAKDPNNGINIIHFYNKRFIHAMRRFICRLADSLSKDANHHEEGEKAVTVQTLPAPPLNPQQVQSYNLYMMPARSTHMTPQTRALYAFGESPTKRLNFINQTLSDSRQKAHQERQRHVLKTRQQQTSDDMMVHVGTGSVLKTPPSTPKKGMDANSSLPEQGHVRMMLHQEMHKQVAHVFDSETSSRMTNVATATVKGTESADEANSSDVPVLKRIKIEEGHDSVVESYVGT